MMRKTVHRFITLVLAGFLWAISGECWTSRNLAQIPPHVFYVAPKGNTSDSFGTAALREQSQKLPEILTDN
ncbi:hypothetical protein QUA46_29150, partial [Microcoleus sp. MON2_D6]|uniref:hypothetical protein n=1 Tax=unclassified Microcoleus TaxID=2642155 RepID=UPI002FCEF244